jgi:hypothetical protein
MAGIIPPFYGSVEVRLNPAEKNALILWSSPDTQALSGIAWHIITSTCCTRQ